MAKKAKWVWAIRRSEEINGRTLFLLWIHKSITCYWKSICNYQFNRRKHAHTYDEKADRSTVCSTYWCSSQFLCMNLFITDFLFCHWPKKSNEKESRLKLAKHIRCVCMTKFQYYIKPSSNRNFGIHHILILHSLNIYTVKLNVQFNCFFFSLCSLLDTSDRSIALRWPNRANRVHGSGENFTDTIEQIIIIEVSN